MAVCMDGSYRFDQDLQHYIRICHTEEIRSNAYDYEQGDRRAAFHASTDIINSSAYTHGTPDMFSGDICGYSGRTFYKDRKGKTMRLDGFGIFVDDMVKMIRFYRDVLGFEIKEEESTKNVYLVKDGTLFLLYGRKDFEKMTSRRYDYVKGFNGHFELALYVDTFDEVDEAYKKAVENGAISVLPPELEPWGQRTCYISDPEGNLIEIGSWNKPYEEKDLTEE